jgi:hypothetical protein
VCTGFTLYALRFASRPSAANELFEGWSVTWRGVDLWAERYRVLTAFSFGGLKLRAFVIRAFNSCIQL